mmetsp:Transcript_9352/g.30441  ORF Transcript_9352/g.30441 Transcript_9352/m.30441 type:complete len:155 (-) Transcript_9352:685-1149(-)
MMTARTSSWPISSHRPTPSPSATTTSTSFGEERVVVRPFVKKVSLRESLPGDRPSCSLLLRKLDPESVGALIAVYEHRTAITGFLLDVNPFDQPGVEHGKTLARAIRRAFFADTTTAKDQHGATPLSTRRLLGRYLALKLEKRRRYFPTSSESK